MFSLIWAKFGKWISAFVAGLLLFASVFYSGRKSGETRAKVEAAEDRAKEREAEAAREVAEVKEAAEREVKVIQNANEVARYNASIDDNAAVDKLCDIWSRD